MKLHANARLSVKGRELLVERIRAGWSLTEAAIAAGVSQRTARKWRDRHRAEGSDGLLDRCHTVTVRRTVDKRRLPRRPALLRDGKVGPVAGATHAQASMEVARERR